MKQLWLVRHAKSDLGYAGLPDFDRTLNKHGLHDASSMGRWLSQHGVSPELMISSPARRTRQTAELISQGLTYPAGRIRFEQKIYEARPDTLLDVIQQVPMEVNRLMLVGHNPGISLLGHMLGGSMDSLPTCAILAMSFDSPDWDLLCYPPKVSEVWLPKPIAG